MKKPRLLLVDDDALISESLAFALAGEYEVTCAADRVAAVEGLREGLRPDLALIDLGLPPDAHLPNEGFKLIGDLLAHAPQVRILVLTGHNPLIGAYPGADGVKTGSTDAAGLVIVGSATHDGHRVYVVVMHSDDLLADSKALFDWVWQSFDWPEG